MAHADWYPRDAQLDGDSPTVNAIIETYPLVEERHRGERVGAHDPAPIDDDRRSQFVMAEFAVGPDVLGGYDVADCLRAACPAAGKAVEPFTNLGDVMPFVALAVNGHT